MDHLGDTLDRITRPTGPAATVLVRLLVGAVFFSEGVQKFLYADTLGVGRFTKIGIRLTAATAPFIGVVEIVFGLLVLVGLLTRLAAVPLLIEILVAIATTKVPMLKNGGFWKTAHEARTDYSMLLGCLFLVLVGTEPISTRKACAGS